MGNRSHTRLRLTEAYHDEGYIAAYNLLKSYRQLKDRYKELSYIGVQSPNLANFGSRTTKPGSGIEELAVKLAEIARKIELLEKTVGEVSDNKEIRKALIESIGEQKTFNDFYPTPPISERTFNRLRQKYLAKIAEKIKGDDDE